MPCVLRLEEECRGLQELALGELEMPGQHLGGQQVAADATLYLEYISANIQVGGGAGGGGADHADGPFRCWVVWVMLCGMCVPRVLA